MDKIYIVESSSGSYDDYGTHIIKCFENKEDAEKYSMKYDRVLRKVSDFCAEAWAVVCDKDYDDNTDDDYKNCFHHSIWSKYHYRMSDYNEVKVIEMPFIEHRRKTNLKNLLD